MALEFEPQPEENNVFAHAGNPPLVLFACDASNAVSSAGDKVNCTLDDADMKMDIHNATTFDVLGNDIILDGGLAEAGRVAGTLDVAVIISNDTTMPNRFRVGLLRQINQTSEYEIPADGGRIEVQALAGNITITLSFGSHVGHTRNAMWVVRVGNQTAPEVVRTPGVREHDLCSNNGICDFEDGSCTCFGDSTGSRCEFVPTAEIFDSDATYLEVFVEDPGFEGPAFVLETQRAESPNFNFIQVIANQNEVLRVDGTGTIFTYRGRFSRTLFAEVLTVQSGQTIVSGGLQVDTGGITIANGGLTTLDDGIYAISEQKFSPVIHALANEPYFTNDVLFLQSNASTNQSFSFIQAEAGADGVVFKVSGHGTTTIGSASSSGGLIIESGGATVNSGGITVTDVGMTIDTGNLFVADI